MLSKIWPVSAWILHSDAPTHSTDLTLSKFQAQISYFLRHRFLITKHVRAGRHGILDPEYIVSNVTRSKAELQT